MKLALVALVALTSGLPALAGESQPGYSISNTCTVNKYREQYVPGSESSPGYVKSWKETVDVPCDESSTTVRQAVPQPQPVADNNDCTEGSIIGGLLGAGIATSSTRGKDQWWAIPAGGAAGAMIGCQIDGG